MTRFLLCAALLGLGCHKAPPARPGSRVQLRERTFHQFRAAPVRLHVTSAVPGETGQRLQDTARRVVGQSLTQAQVTLADEASAVIELSIDRFGAGGSTPGKCAVLTVRVVRGGQAFAAVEHTAQRCVIQDQPWKGQPSDLLGAAIELATIALKEPELVGSYDSALTEILDQLDR